MEEERLPAEARNFVHKMLNDPLLLGMLSAVPYFGGTFATFFSAKQLETYRARTEKMFQQLTEHLEHLDESTVNEGYFDTPEGRDLLMGAVDASNKTRSDEKRDLIVQILVGAASTESEQGGYSSEDYFNIAAYLTPKELEVARTLYRLQRDDRRPSAGQLVEVWSRHRDKLIEEHKLDADSELPLVLNRIASTGLIMMVYELYAGGHTVPTYWVTPTFDRLMEFLSLSSTPLPES